MGKGAGEGGGIPVRVRAEGCSRDSWIQNRWLTDVG